MLTKRPIQPRAASSSVRIISGSLRGSKLPVPPLPGLRPTPDRVRETLFNWLRPSLPGMRVLDLFAGSGALGIEALSLGAKDVLFVEAHNAAAQSLREQLSRLKVSDHAAVQVLNASAPQVLHTLDGAFDLIFLDPPYALDLWAPCLGVIAQRKLLRENGLIYLEWPEPGSAPAMTGWSWHRRTRAGAVGFGLLRQEPRELTPEATSVR